MRTRVIQMINNYYKDEEDESTTFETDNDIALGEYCCLGHFDALHIELVEYQEEKMQQDMRGQINDFIVEKFNGYYNMQNIRCVTYNDEKDKKFWKEAEGMPFLFVSLANINHVEEQMSKRLYQLLLDFDETDRVMAYYTYDHSEIVVLRTGESYVQGFHEILSLYEKVNIFKMYTVFAVKEDVLEKCENVHEEIIGCRLYATVKNWREVKAFKQKLASVLQKKEDDIKMYKTLGKCDCLMEIPQVSIKQILYYYRMGNLLTHTNEYYKKAFFNIESQFLVEVKEDEPMGD